MKPLRMLLLALVIGVSLSLLIYRQDVKMLAIMLPMLGLLLFFSVVWRVMKRKHAASANEIRDTLTNSLAL